jgi:hypothetical protein
MRRRALKYRRTAADPRRMSERWWRYRRIAANGRVEVACAAADDHQFWLDARELANWTVCPHCVGWISHWPADERPAAA